MSPARRWDRRWDLGAVAVIAASLVAHLRFLWMDARVPRDPGLYYKGVPKVHAALTEGQLGAVLAELVQPAGWYNVLLGLGTYAFGRRPEIMDAAILFWLVVALVAAWRAGRHLGGPAAGFAMAALVAASPMIVIIGRTPWIHAPEVALVLVALAAWLGDRALSRRHTVATLAATGVLAITLRHSGLVWMGPLGLALLWPTGQPRRWKRLAVVLGAWVLSLAVPAQQLQDYMTAKLAARDRYEADLPGLGEQLGVNLGLPLVLVGLAGIALLLWRKPERRDPAEWLLGAWAGLVLLLWAGFRAGIDNFPALGVAVAGLAALGLVRVDPRIALVALLAFLPAHLPQWVAPERLAWASRLPGGPSLVMEAHPRNWYRPWRGFGWQHVRALLDATCPGALPGECAVVVDQGLFEPYVEDPGHFELFLVGEDRVRLLALRDHPELGLDATYQALADYTCPGQQEQWEQRFPRETARRRALEESGSLAPAWARPTAAGCVFVWWTPGGQLADEAALPADGQRIVDGDLTWVEAITAMGPQAGPMKPGLDGDRTPGSFQGLPAREGDPAPPSGANTGEGATIGEPGAFLGLPPLEGPEGQGPPPPGGAPTPPEGSPDQGDGDGPRGPPPPGGAPTPPAPGEGGPEAAPEGPTQYQGKPAQPGDPEPGPQ